ncbi:MULTISPECIES: ferredoxin--NADP reductase [Spongiibacter]|uniref:ferredoxin--NADP reductase n=1 Tax=Spongiibacter TaxID=630749 RepID=UPI0003B3AE02|nr:MULTISPECIES: ferredoxin--NADP reductase [Spongiibacter]MAY38283.1 ferredoxin--NADP reductase [Spongiibacter sp.]MBO6754167.1 ferredoxin--NADP reductase [Spongiibacter sp.]MBU71980.1 ferredoxin--NADP reductase [Spongiibacter sp.]
MSKFIQETVTHIHHWNDSLFSFRTSRQQSLRFENGHFIMIGLEVEGKPLMRAYSVASANYQPELEFFSIKVPDGPLTSRLQNIQVGDRVIMSTKPTGTLIAGNLKPGKHLYLLGTGTGLAPFLSIIRDPDIYERFEKIILVHGVRHVSELAYQQLIEEALPQDEYLGDCVREQLIYYPTVTREPYKHNGRITDLMTSGKLFLDIGLPKPTSDDDRFMLCGSPSMLKDLCRILDERGFTESRHGHLADYVIERAFVEQ